MGKPLAVAEAEIVEAICQRYHVTPDRALRLDAYTLRHMAILELAHPSEGAG